MKMTLTDELKILEDKIKTNQAQYDVDREAAKISPLSSKELNKYEYMIDKDLVYKPGVLERAKFEYFPLGEALTNKAKKETDKKDKLEKEARRKIKICLIIQSVVS